ncbi:hypothetical protein [Streptomyces phytophilus]|uniref:hypothetical protein n=1 Tax=Streptomyces phytophilus TaxID=722715 RepID=UPI0015F10038|nr:hypothetical protein [Streptomyces phytophilus]
MPKLPQYRPPSIGQEDEFDGYAVALNLGTWAYALDDSPGLYGPGWYPFYREVTRREPDPHNLTAHVGRDVLTGKIEPTSVRISPDKEFRAWRNETVTLYPFHNDARVKALTRLYVGPVTVRRTEIVTDLREQSVILPDGIPGSLRVQAEVKGQRILDFLNAARSERQRGRPAPYAVVHREMRPQTDDEPMLVIGRINGSSSRRQRRFATVERGEAAIKRWAGQGFTVFWTRVGDKPLSKPFRLVDGRRVDIE